jgi:hypothetical protein
MEMARSGGSYEAQGFFNGTICSQGMEMYAQSIGTVSILVFHSIKFVLLATQNEDERSFNDIQKQKMLTEISEPN